MSWQPDFLLVQHGIEFFVAFVEGVTGGPKEVVINICPAVATKGGGDRHKCMAVYEVEQHRTGLTLPNTIVYWDVGGGESIEGQDHAMPVQHHSIKIYGLCGIPEPLHVQQEAVSHCIGERAGNVKEENGHHFLFLPGILDVVNQVE